MTVRELREKYLAFFESKGHLRHASGSLVPYDVTGRLDESLLFNGAGMIQFKPYFRGAAKPPHPRLTTVQKCVRTGDIDEVGDDTHLTFFEMLGNFSFGDYFKAEAIGYSWEFLTSPEWLALDPARLSFTVFETDDEAETAWRACGARHVFRLGEETNYWPAGAFTNGPPGPCGPNSEMFYWTASEPAPGEDYGRADWERDEAAGKWVEIWNDVFIQYEWQGEPLAKGYRKTGMPELPFRSIDTGMGLERTAMVLSGKTSVYDTDAFTRILSAIREVARPARSSVSDTGSASESPEIVKRDGAHLPHWTKEGGTYFVTYRLADAVPAAKREEWRMRREAFRQLEAEGKTRRRESVEFSKAFSEGVDRYLDAGEGSCLLRDPRAAEIVAENLRHFDDERYRLHAWVVMPNHVHAVVEPLGEHTLSQILHSWKSYTAHAINKSLDRQGDVWMDESYDHLVRDEGDLLRTVRYTLDNPVNAGLKDWPYVAGDGTEPVPDTLDRAGRATRVVADHVRTAVFCIGDGVLPSNNGRGYVLRRLIRRAVLKGARELELPEGFLARVAEAVLDEYADVYAELREQRTVIIETLRNEETLFRRTLKTGTERLRVLLESGAGVSGEAAFQLYDTFGFPLEVTRELAAEASLEVDVEGYELALQEAQARSRGADAREAVYGGGAGVDVIGDPTPTEFLGYAETEADATVIAVRTGPDGVAIALDRTPFYAESGGQTGDTGTLVAGPSRSPVSATILVAGTTKQGGVFWHRLSSETGTGTGTGTGDAPTTLLGQKVHAQVDLHRRHRIEPHHTATHLLHLALREELGDHATQAGSDVGPDRLRFDFTHGAALTAEQRNRIEKRVNELARANDPVTTYADISPAEAKAKGAMALFGEKYGDKVRMVEVGLSKELCGGTHVRTAAECHPFRIVSEGSAASGVRRIEAVAGAAAVELYEEERARLLETAAALKARPDEIVAGAERLQKELKEERSKRERAERAALSGGAAAAQEIDVEGLKLLVLQLGETDPKTVQALVQEKAANRPELVIVSAATGDGKLLFSAKAGADAVARGAHAGNLLKVVAAVAGGGGGGRAEFATAGGKDASKLEDALTAAEPALRAMLKS